MHFSIHALPRVKRTFNVKLKTHVLRMLHILVKVDGFFCIYVITRNNKNYNKSQIL